ncbi:GntR family transcriptional regulator [Solwaraspora sp. WMMB762]|uniref:GntR family transcriptional regulator n=1 Tax=Solwaraspora sp. WMMB762 TaxID=3404120 RepID=UPI003B947B34
MPPLYRKIADELRAQIINGVLKPGDHLPTESKLQDLHRVSRNTVRLATAVLINEGLVESMPGRTGGIIVRDRVTLAFHASRAEMPGPVSESDAWFSEVRDQGHEPTQTFELRIAEVPDGLAERLGVPADSPAAVRRCVRAVNGQPSSIQDTYYPMDLCDQVPELLSPRDIPQGTTRLLAERGHPQVAYDDEIIAAMPAPDEVTTLTLTAGTPVLRWLRTGYTPDRPVRVSVSTFAADRNRLLYTLGDPDVIANIRASEDPQ